MSGGVEVLRKPPHSPEAVLLGFTRALRAAGLPVTQDRAQGYLDATAVVGLDDRRATYAAGRATLCASPDDLQRYDQVFAAYFGDPEGLTTPRRGRPAPPLTSALAPLGDDPAGASELARTEVVAARASDAEVLRHRDVATLSPVEQLRLASLFATLHPRPPRRRTGRHQRWHRGELDAARTMRQSLRRAGEPAVVEWRRRRSKPRRVVLLIDVSGSMSGYADALLRLAHRMVVATSSTSGNGGASRAGSRSVEVFTLGTRLTHLTRALRSRDPERALVAAGSAVPDWSGGTRLGETLAAFIDRWGRRGLARGAVVVVFSDGWERGSAEQLGEQVRRLRRVAHRVVWVNPHRGRPGYEPLQQGILAVLPHCDEFLAGHSLATFEELLEVIARA